MSSSPFVLSVRSGQAPAQKTILKMNLKCFWPLASSSHFAFEGSPLCSSGFWISPPLLSCLSPVYKETNGYGWFLDKKDRKERNPHPSRSPHLGEGLLHLVHVQPLAHQLTLCEKTPPTIIRNQQCHHLTSSLTLSTENVWLVEEVSSTPEPLLRRRKQSTWQLLVWDQLERKQSTWQFGIEHKNMNWILVIVIELTVKSMFFLSSNNVRVWFNWVGRWQSNMLCPFTKSKIRFDGKNFLLNFAGVQEKLLIL